MYRSTLQPWKWRKDKLQDVWTRKDESLDINGTRHALSFVQKGEEERAESLSSWRCWLDGFSLKLDCCDVTGGTSCIWLIFSVHFSSFYYAHYVLKLLTWRFLFETGCTQWWHKMELLVAMYPVAQVRLDCCYDLFSSLFNFLLYLNHHWVKKGGL